MTTKDGLKDVYYNRSFLQDVEALQKQKPQEACCMIAVDIAHFRLFNKFYGRNIGNQLITAILEELKAFSTERGGTAGHFGADNFAIFLPYEKETVQDLQLKIQMDITRWDNTGMFYPLLGVYIVQNAEEFPELIFDRASMALSYTTESQMEHICYYTEDMETKPEEEFLLLSEIQNALKNKEFIFYVQPQCNIATGKIVGGEALARWRKPDGTMVSPGVFIPIMEKNKMVQVLDAYVWECVCQWLREWIDRGYMPVPISINVSRIDIMSMDVPAYLFSLIEKYQLPEKLIKVEITESAYIENNGSILDTVNILRNHGLLVMMDDFGCGYSSLNMLKNIPVDVLKLDMKFLDIGENEQQKGINILESVVNMARLLRLPIVVEGVETEHQEQFVKELGCRYTQGFYYYKPLPVEEFENLLIDDRNVEYRGMIYKQVEPLHVREFMDSNIMSDSMLNHIVGPVAFYEMYDRQITITRVNEEYLRLFDVSPGENYGRQFWNHVRDDDRALLYTVFETAYLEKAAGAQENIHVICTNGTNKIISMRVFFLKEKDGHRQYYSALTDITSLADEASKAVMIQSEEECLTDVMCKEAEHCFGKWSDGFCIHKLVLDGDGKPVDFQIVYANGTIRRICRGSMQSLKDLAHQVFLGREEQVYACMYQAAFEGETGKVYIYSHISNRYLEFTFYQYQSSYIGCVIRDMTEHYVSEMALGSIMHSYREVYFLQLKDNYYRMIYPEEQMLEERGNYEEAINRHFSYGKIINGDEINIRQFLSLEHLRNVLKKQDVTEMSYQRFSPQNQKEWCQTSVIVSEREEDGTPKNAIMVIRSVDTLLQGAKKRRGAYLSEALASMSDGFLIYRAIEEEKILYANPGVLKLYGCTSMEEFMELVSGSFRGMVYHEDLERIEWEIRDQVQHSNRNMDYIEYRIMRKDGQIRWVEDYGHLENEAVGDGIGLYYVFLKDVTENFSEDQKRRIEVRNRCFNETKDKNKDKNGETYGTRKI